VGVGVGVGEPDPPGRYALGVETLGVGWRLSLSSTDPDGSWTSVTFTVDALGYVDGNDVFAQVSPGSNCEPPVRYEVFHATGSTVPSTVTTSRSSALASGSPPSCERLSTAVVSDAETSAVGWSVSGVTVSR
jgi:hypothetical protein